MSWRTPNTYPTAGFRRGTATQVPRDPGQPPIQEGLDWYAGSDRDFDLLFTIDILMIPASRGYPWLIHSLTYRGNSDEYLGVLGNREGTTTTPLDMVILIDHDQFDLVMDDIDCVPSLGLSLIHI